MNQSIINLWNGKIILISIFNFGDVKSKLVLEEAEIQSSLRDRPLDILIVLFFTINVLFITYIVDLEQLVIKNPSNFTYPIWPPPFFVDLIHHYGYSFDPLLIARPVWWKMTIWIDAIFFGPFYVAAIYAFTKRKEWIKVPSLVWAGSMLSNVIIILGEEILGPNATPHPLIVILLNLPWLIMPFVVIFRIWSKSNSQLFVIKKRLKE